MSPDRHTVRLSPDAVMQVIDGETLLVDLRRETVFALDRTGTRIAVLLAGGHSVGDVVRRLSAEYDVPAADLAQDVGDLVRALERQGLVVVERGGSVS